MVDFSNTVPCKLCGIATLHTGTKRCDSCWELEHRIHGNVDMALKVLADINPKLKALRRELALAPMKSNFTFTRDELIGLIGVG